MLRYMTAGESHGYALIAILDGMPSGLNINVSFIDKELRARMAGYGRSARMKIEKDKVDIISGVRKNKTTGSPISILIKNRDFSIERLPSITKARPGHADLAGALKYGEKDIRNILERASARETASRVAVGAIAKILLSEFKIYTLSHVVAIGGIDIAKKDHAEELMKKEIASARLSGDTLGGICEIIVKGLPPGLGSVSEWDRRLDGNLARGLMSIPSVKGVSIGGGFDIARKRGSQVHDVILYNKSKGFYRMTNNAGGIEGGITNGEDIVLRIAVKPIPTLGRPLNSIDIKTKKKVKAQVERADVCVVPSCGVIAESVSALEIANAMVEKFGGDSLAEMKRNYEGYMMQVRRF